MKKINFKNSTHGALAALLATICALSPASNAYAQNSIDDFSVLPENLTSDVVNNPNVLIILDNSSSMSYLRADESLNDDADVKGPNDGEGDYWVDPVTGIGYLDRTRLSGGATNLRHHDPSSSATNSYQVRKAMLKILASPLYRNRLNVGLMAFGQKRCEYQTADDNTNKGDNEKPNRRLNLKCSDINKLKFSATTGLGSLKANIEPLDEIHLNKLEGLLAYEPSYWRDKNIRRSNEGSDDLYYIDLPGPRDTNSDPVVHGLKHPFYTKGFIDGTEEPIISAPLGVAPAFTPLAGSLDSAFRYLFNKDVKVKALATGNNDYFDDGLYPREYSLGKKRVKNPATGAITSSNENVALKYLSESQCQGPLTVILLTDGDATQTLPISDVQAFLNSNPAVNRATGIGQTAVRTGQGEKLETLRTKAREQAVEIAKLIHLRGNTDANLVSEEDRVKVHVIAFNLRNKVEADKIAIAGGTTEATRAESTEDVEAAFGEIFNGILNTGATRSGLSVVTTPDAATGSFIQPSFTPLIRETTASGTAESVAWTGDLRAFYIDGFGNFREESSGNTQLDQTDKGFRILFDGASKQTYVEKFDVAADGTEGGLTGNVLSSTGTNTTFNGGIITVDKLEPIFDVSEQLDSLSDNVSDIRENRGFTTAVNSTGASRFIFTTLPGNGTTNPLTSGGVKHDFIDLDSAGTDDVPFPTSSYYTFDLATRAAGGQPLIDDAKDLISFIRGDESNANNRNRTLSNRKYILGDIVHSTPVQVDAPPRLGTDNDYADTYSAYREYFKDRRKMIYFGANDGMLHAISGGFWNVESTPGTQGTVEINRTSGIGTANHRLGDEVWAYIPNAVLPHLKFLRGTDYLADKHISFVDGSLQTFDVKIFENETNNCTIPGDESRTNCEYINGWGTILVGGLRLGGAEYEIDANNDGDTTDANEGVFRSSYFIIDVTNPETEPKVLGEVSHPDLELTTSKPVLVRRKSTSTNDREHYLVFGSGPNDIKTITATDGVQANLFVYDLDKRSSGLTKSAVTGANTNSFIGDLSAADWNQDDIDDAIYFGTIAGTTAVPTGKLFRGTFSSTNAVASSVILNDSGPIQHEPVIPRDQATRSEKYVLFGAGRTFSIEDTKTEYPATNKNFLFGIKESITGLDTNSPIIAGGTINDSQLLDTTSVDKTAVTDADNVLGANDRTDILNEFTNNTYKGWKFELPKRVSRLSARGTTLEELVFFTDFQPDLSITNSNQCSAAGGGFLSVFDYRTGIFPSQDRLLLSVSANTGESTTNALNFQVSSSLLGAGEIIIIGENDDGNKDFKFLAPGSNQEITEFKGTLIPRASAFDSGRKSWREISF